MNVMEIYIGDTGDKFLLISITKCPHWQKVTKTHSILSNMKKYESGK